MLVGALAAPALGALLAAAAPAGADRAGRAAGTAAAAVAFVATLLMWPHHAPIPGAGPAGGGSGGGGGPVIVPWHSIDVPWVPSLNLRFHLGVDGVSYPLVVLTALLTLLCCVYSLWRVPAPGRGRHLVALLLVIELGIMGVFLSLDLVLFFVFFEIVLLPMYAVIAVWGGPRRRYASRKFVLYTLFGSVLLLVGVFTVVVKAGTADLVVLTGGTAGAGAGLSRGTQLFAFTLLAVAFAVKSPLWPLHTW